MLKAQRLLVHGELNPYFWIVMKQVFAHRWRLGGEIRHDFVKSCHSGFFDQSILFGTFLNARQYAIYVGIYKTMTSCHV